MFIFCQVCLPVKETAEIETEMAENSSWGQANLWQKLGLVLRNRKKTSQIIKDYLPFFLLIYVRNQSSQRGANLARQGSPKKENRGGSSGSICRRRKRKRRC
jgi:hypothetical protein